MMWIQTGNCLRELSGNAVEFLESLDGEDTVKKLKIRRPDLLLLDLNMPRMSGFDVAEFVRKDQKLKDLPIIAISATKISHKEENRARLFDVFVAKPFRVTDFVEILKKYLPFKEISRQVARKEPQGGEELVLSPLDKKGSEKLKADIFKLMESMDDIIESSSFDEIRMLLTLVSEYDIPVLKLKAEQIMAAAENFDIEEIIQSMNDLPEIFKRILNEYDKRTAGNK